jgi:hypothetical protein
MGGYERFIMGYQSQGGRQDLNRIITFKEYSPVVHQNGSVDFPSCLVEISYVWCARGCHMNPPGKSLFLKKREAYVSIILQEVYRD